MGEFVKSFDRSFMFEGDAGIFDAENWGARTRPLAFCVFHNTEALLKNSSYSQLLKGFFSPESLRAYRSLGDLLFCELYPEWKEPCFRFYAGRGGRLFSYAEVSPKQLLEWDRFLSDCALPRLKDLFLKGRRRWSSVLLEMKLPPPPLNARASGEKLPSSLRLSHQCSEALEQARLRGILCRHIHELVESARFNDELWFDRALSNIKKFVQSMPAGFFGSEMATKILSERLAYVSTLAQYYGVRKRLLVFLRSARLKQAARSSMSTQPGQNFGLNYLSSQSVN